MQFIQHNDSRRVYTRKQHHFAPGAIERYSRPRSIKTGLFVGAVILIVAGWVVKTL